MRHYRVVAMLIVALMVLPALAALLYKNPHQFAGRSARNSLDSPTIWANCFVTRRTWLGLLSSFRP